MQLRASFLLASLLLGACAVATPAPPKCPDVPAPSPPVSVAASPSTPAADADSVITAGDFTITVRATPFGNLAYQLDCLADLIHCSTDAIRPTWSTGWTKEDDDALATWKATRKMYSGDTPLGGDAPRSLVPLPHSDVEIDKQLRIAALLSKTPADFRANVRAIMPPHHAERLVTAAERFRPRFDAWWSASGSSVANRFRTALAQMFAREDIAQIVTRAGRFYATPLAKGTPIDFDLIVLPGKSEGTGGEQMLAHGVIEVKDDEKPESRMDVVCHELFHFFFNARSPEQQASLAARFTSSSDPLGAVAYFLLDESVATALGNGLVAHAVDPSAYARRLKREEGFYTNHAIDAAAKGLLARTKEDPTLGPSLDAPESALKILDAVHDAIGDEPRPIEYLHTYAGEFDEGWWDEAMKATRRAANATNEHRSTPLGSPDGVAMVKEHPALSAVYLVPRGRLAALVGYGDAIPAEARGAIAREAKKKGAFAYVAKRSAQARSFVIVADDVAGAKSVADALFAEKKAIVGVYRPALAAR
jgi:hypothetical protein